MKNQIVAEILYKIADILDIKGEIFFKTRAYRMAAQKIEVLNDDIEIIVKQDRLQEIPGIGEALAKKIKEIVETGHLIYYERLKKEIPEGLLAMLDIPGLGPKKVAAIYQKLGIKTIDELKNACIKKEIRNLEGFGEITERNILRGIDLMKKTSGRILLNLAYRDGNNYIDFLKKCENLERLNIAGSLRRMKDTIGDIDIIVSSDKPDRVMDHFIKYDEIQRILMKGNTKTSVILKDDVQVDLRVVKDESFGAALQYFTGSKEHNVKMRSIAIKKGFKLNEYGLFNKNNNEYIIGKNENEIYKKLGLSYIEPELRENRGEIEAALNNTLPKLVNYDDIIGDLHIHSNWSDGIESIDTIADYCKKIGYKYVGIADHSQSLKVARGLSEEKIIKKFDEIKKINKKLKDFKVLFGTECDIKSDGSLDYSNKILKLFDFVGIAIHTNLKMDQKAATNRIISGMENEYVTFLAHPTCRIIRKREPFDIDIDKIFEKAKETKIFLEINSFPDRLDLNDINTKQAKEKGLKFLIGTDAHNLNHLAYIKFGIAISRRGWLEKSDILNTNSLKDLGKILRM